MTVWDIFSWLSEKEIGIERIKIFLKSYEGIADNTYVIVHEISENTGTDMIDCKNELLSEEKNENVKPVLHDFIKRHSLVGFDVK